LWWLERDGELVKGRDGGREKQRKEYRIEKEQ
jgi:hypothetical protein